MVSTTLYGQLKSESQHRAAPSITAHSFDSLSNDNVFQWTEEVALSGIITDNEAETDEPLCYQYQIWTGKPDHRDPYAPKNDLVEVAFGV